MKNRKKVSGYINPELPNMENTSNPLKDIPIPKSMEDCKNAAERVLFSCVTLFQTTNTDGVPTVIPNDPYDQTIARARNRAIRASDISHE